MATKTAKALLGVALAVACLTGAPTYQLFFRDYATVHVNEGELRDALQNGRDREGVEKALQEYGIKAYWSPEDRALRGTVHNVEGTTALQSVSLTFEVLFDNQGKLVRSEVHGGVVGL